MEHAAEGISRGDLLAYASSRGVTVTSAQLDRWRKAGLLPRPERRSRGRPLGTEAIYPPGTGAQLLAVAEQLRARRALDEALWQLWWAGYAVSITRVRRQLDHVLTELERCREYVISRSRSGNTDDLRQAIEGWVGRRPLDEEQHRLRRRISRSGMAVLTALAIDVQLGLYDGVVNQGAESGLLEELMDAHVATTPPRDTDADAVIGNPVELLTTLSHELDPARLRQALRQASDSEIEDTRVELQKLFAGADALLDWVEGAFSVSINRGLFDLGRVRTEQKYLLLLFWLSIRRRDAVRQGYEAAMDLVHLLTAGRTVRIVGESIEVADDVEN